MLQTFATNAVPRVDWSNFDQQPVAGYGTAIGIVVMRPLRLPWPTGFAEYSADQASCCPNLVEDSRKEHRQSDCRRQKRDLETASRILYHSGYQIGLSDDERAGLAQLRLRLLLAKISSLVGVSGQNWGRVEQQRHIFEMLGGTSLSNGNQRW